MRTLLLLLISFSSYGQIITLFSGLPKRPPPVTPPVETVYSLVDDDTYGTGSNQIEYTGTWVHGSGKSGSYDGSFSYSNNGTNDGNNSNDAKAIMDFTGVGVDVYISKYPTHGIAAISIDGGAETLVDMYGSVSIGILGFSATGLTDGNHTITVRVTGTKNASSTEYYAEIDAFGVYSTVSNPPTPVTGDWYVDADMVTSGNGLTHGSDFKTIQEAASVAQPGDEIRVYAGTYRETVTFTNSGSAGNPIILSAAESGVYISGLETASGSWSVHSGNIYKKAITLPVNGYNLTFSTNTTLAANQVFKDGDMIIEARWPKVANVDELFDRSKLLAKSTGGVSWDRVSPGSTTNWDAFITYSAIPDVDLTGAKIWVSGWFAAQTGTVKTSNSSNNLTYWLANGSGNTNPEWNQYTYVTGKLALLTQANEFHYDGTYLYVWQTGGGSPTGIEYKARNWGIDLSGKSYITIRGINMMGCEINGNTSTANITIDNIRVRYQNHAFLQEAPGDVIGNSLYWNSRQTGLKLLGANNVVKNSEFDYASSNCIWIGANGLIDNNLIEHVSYEGNYGAGITVWDNADNVVISNNDFNVAGRSAIDFGSVTNDTHLNNVINNNDLYQFGCLSSDGGGIYAARYMRLDGTRVHHNWIHGSLASHATGGGSINGINAGIYYDHATGAKTVNDHNVLWDNKQCDLHISTCWHTDNRNMSPGKAEFYNNTCVTRVNDGYVHGYFSYLNISQEYHDIERNNIFRARNINVTGSNWDDAHNNSLNANYGDNLVFHTTNYDVNNSLNSLGLKRQNSGDTDHSSSYTTSPGFAGGETFNPTTVANPETYFQLAVGSAARNIGTLVTGINSDDTGGYDAGAYTVGTTAWTAGYTSVTYVP